MRVLLLNQSYEPIKLISWKKAIILFLKEKVSVIKEYNILIRSEKLTFKMPAVICLKKYINVRNYQILRFSKENILFRDNYTCAYCGKQFPKNKLTQDHITPLSKGGTHDWYNTVTACNNCNTNKGNRLIGQLNIKELYVKPFAPSHNSYIQFHIKQKKIPKQWQIYLPLLILTYIPILGKL